MKKNPFIKTFAKVAKAPLNDLELKLIVVKLENFSKFC